MVSKILLSVKVNPKGGLTPLAFLRLASCLEKVSCLRRWFRFPIVITLYQVKERNGQACLQSVPERLAHGVLLFPPRFAQIPA